MNRFRILKFTDGTYAAQKRTMIFWWEYIDEDLYAWGGDKTSYVKRWCIKKTKQEAQKVIDMWGKDGKGIAETIDIKG